LRHAPSKPQGGLAWHPSSERGGVPSATAPQWPSSTAVPFRALEQPRQSPVQAASQHTPSAQKPVLHTRHPLTLQSAATSQPIA
jgi:hypothetical protein